MQHKASGGLLGECKAFVGERKRKGQLRFCVAQGRMHTDQLADGIYIYTNRIGIEFTAHCTRPKKYTESMLMEEFIDSWFKKKKFGSGGIRTHAIEMTGA